MCLLNKANWAAYYIRAYWILCIFLATLRARMVPCTLVNGASLPKLISNELLHRTFLLELPLYLQQPKIKLTGWLARYQKGLIRLKRKDVSHPALNCIR